MLKIILVILVLISLTSCIESDYYNASLDDIRKVRINMSTDELLQIVGKPRYIDFDNGNEVWTFPFENGHKRSFLEVNVFNDTVIGFKS